MIDHGSLDRSEVVGATVVAVGTGLIAFMVGWLSANRALSTLAGAPLGPLLAMVVALTAGAVTTWVARRRLLDTLRLEALRSERTR